MVVLDTTSGHGWFRLVWQAGSTEIPLTDQRMADLMFECFKGLPVPVPWRNSLREHEHPGGFRSCPFPTVVWFGLEIEHGVQAPQSVYQSACERVCCLHSCTIFACRTTSLAVNALNIEASALPTLMARLAADERLRRRHRIQRDARSMFCLAGRMDM